MFSFGQTVTVYRQSSVEFDPFGDPVSSTQSSFQIDHCAVAPRYSSEQTDRGRQGSIIGLSLYAPIGTEILLTDRVVVDGLTYLVDGEPGDWNNPFSGTSFGVEVALRRGVG